MSHIDWEECQKRSLTSLKIQACELWNEHYDIKKISEIMKRDRGTICTWLKLCASLEMCDYDTKNQMRTCKRHRKIRCVEIDEYFNSIIDANKKYNVNAGCIISCCKGKRNYAGKLPDGTKLHWQYVD